MNWLPYPKVWLQGIIRLWANGVLRNSGPIASRWKVTILILATDNHC